MLTQIFVKPVRVMARQKPDVVVLVERTVGIILGGRRLGIVPVFHGLALQDLHGLALQDQGSPLPDHLGHLETVQGLSGKRTNT